MDNISYDLAKRLKDAGFPGSTSWLEVTDDDGRPLCFLGSSEGPIVPSLSELIEACGVPIWLEGSSLVGFLWMAGRGRGMDTPLGRGGTPEEAVANLWLALNEK